MITKLSPAFKDYIWGGQKLKTSYNKKFEGEILAESWELSCHCDGSSILLNGDHAGQSLKDYTLKDPKAVGTYADGFKDFPILIKFIDSKQDLSIQVHPDDEYALTNEGEYGKNEMWYIVEANPGAKIYYGVSSTISKEEFLHHIKQNSLTDILNEVPVKAGDCFYIAAGTIHAICAGIVIAEIQQNSNTTYRVYDYGRTGADGNQRPLHIDKAIDVSTLSPTTNIINDAQNLIDCKYFAVDDLNINGTQILTADDTSFHSLLILDGCGSIASDSEELSITKGDSVFISACSGNYTVNGNCHLLLTRLGTPH